MPYTASHKLKLDFQKFNAFLSIVEVLFLWKFLLKVEIDLNLRCFFQTFT